MPRNICNYKIIKFKFIKIQKYILKQLSITKNLKSNNKECLFAMKCTLTLNLKDTGYDSRS